MGINAIVLENYADHNTSRTSAKKQSDAFKSLIDMAAKKQSSENCEEKSNCGAGSKTDTKVDKKADAEAKRQDNEDHDVNKKDKGFENEKNSFIQQAFLARNFVDVVNIEIEPVQDVVLTGAVENGQIIPQIVEVNVAEVGQENVAQNVVDVAGQEVFNKANIIKTGADNPETKTDAGKDEKPTFKLADILPKEVVSDKKISQADMNAGNSQGQVESQGKTQEDATTQKGVTELKVEGENIYAKKENNEINSEAQITTAQDKDVIVIKVADPVNPSTGKELAENLGNEIVVKLDSGAKEFNAVLNPKGLGEIAVKLTVESGKVLVHMTCSNETTKALLENNVSSLVKIVEGNMGQEAVVNVYNEKDSSQENFDGQGNKGQYQGGSQNNQGDNDEPETDFMQKLRLGIMEMEGV